MAQDRGKNERPAAVYDRDRWTGHSFHSRPFKTRKCVAADSHARMARLDRRTDEDYRSADESDAFHLVIPSMPGYGYSGKPSTTGWDVAHIARAWIALMKRLGYTKFVAQ